MIIKRKDPFPKAQCAWVIQPGELVIDIFDGKRCAETSLTILTFCEHCEKYFCLAMNHWHKHLDEIHPCEMPTDHPYYSDKEHCIKCNERKEK